MLAALEAHSRKLLGIADEEEDDETVAESSAMAQRRAVISHGEDEDDEDEEEMSDDGWGAGDGMISDSEDEFAVGGLGGVKKGKVITLPE